MKTRKEIKEKIKQIEGWKEGYANTGNTEAFDKWLLVINYLKWVLFTTPKKPKQKNKK